MLEKVFGIENHFIKNLRYFSLNNVIICIALKHDGVLLLLLLFLSLLFVLFLFCSIMSSCQSKDGFKLTKNTRILSLTVRPMFSV